MINAEAGRQVRKNLEAAYPGYTPEQSRAYRDHGEDVWFHESRIIHGRVLD
ncbi:MAG TPA: hypothetical protein PLL72_17710 [Burkholderiaceae bacterium]|jgi:hypothetical protein|nr:hypothetical protein [Burkholderiaceae bacterium]